MLGGLASHHWCDWLEAVEEKPKHEKMNSKRLSIPEAGAYRPLQNASRRLQPDPNAHSGKSWAKSGGAGTSLVVNSKE